MSREVSTDATPYVRACEPVVALGINPVWIPMVALSVFLGSIVVYALTGVVILFLLYAKRKGKRPVDLVRRAIRWAAGDKRKPFRGF